MLVLTRKRGQSLLIGDETEVIILEITGDTVKIGINAPFHIKVYRKELYEEVKDANMLSVVKSKEGMEDLLKK
ncbi:MAG: carbon storage regulator CsrA [bacterium]